MHLKDWTLYVQLATERRSLKISIQTAVVVNGINQGDLLYGLNFTQINWLKFFLTFLVPFLVASYASTTTKFQFAVGSLSYLNANLNCLTCGSESIAVARGKPIPACIKCREDTNWKYLNSKI